MKKKIYLTNNEATELNDRNLELSETVKMLKRENKILQKSFYNVIENIIKHHCTPRITYQYGKKIITFPYYKDGAKQIMQVFQQKLQEYLQKETERKLAQNQKMIDKCSLVKQVVAQDIINKIEKQITMQKEIDFDFIEALKKEYNVDID